MENESDDKVMDGKGYPESWVGINHEKSGLWAALRKAYFSAFTPSCGNLDREHDQPEDRQPISNESTCLIVKR